MFALKGLTIHKVINMFTPTQYKPKYKRLLDVPLPWNDL